MTGASRPTAKPMTMDIPSSKGFHVLQEIGTDGSTRRIAAE